MVKKMIKAGVTLILKELQGTGRIVKKCKCNVCVNEMFPYMVLPCGCYHGLINQCTCKLKDWHCKRCKRVFVPMGNLWFEVEDPHRK
jgi:hypothetical protein